MNDKKPHFWIPDEEVERVSKKPTGRTTPRDIVYSEHGAKLSHGLQLLSKPSKNLKKTTPYMMLDYTYLKLSCQRAKKFSISLICFPRMECT